MNEDVEQRLVQLWFALRGGRELPLIGSLDPTDIADLLPWIAIVDIAPDFLDSRMIMFGSGIAGVVGRDWTGNPLRAIDFGLVSDAIFEPYRTAIAARAPLHCRERRRGADGPWRGDSRIMLPFATPSRPDDVVRLVVAVLFDPISHLAWAHSIDEWEVLDVTIHRRHPSTSTPSVPAKVAPVPRRRPGSGLLWWAGAGS